MDRLSRDAKWNLFLAVLVLSSSVAVHLAGTPWPVIGTVLGGALVFGAVLALALTPLIRWRMHNPTGVPFPVPFDAEQAHACREVERAVERRQLAAIDWAPTEREAA